jgi:Zn-dependent peptidase ImmA (M78 family)
MRRGEKSSISSGGNVAKFRISSDNIQQTPGRQEIIETLLHEAAATRLPTDEGKILEFLELGQLGFDFMHEVDFLPKHQGKAAEIRAALSINDRLVVTQSGLSEKRKRFGIFHEIGHFISPEHRDLFTDTDATLSWLNKVRMEREANEIAAELVFQGNRFTEESLNAATSIRTVLELAPRYGASYESALRRYTERHVLPVALAVFDKVPRDSGDEHEDEIEFKLQYTITSPTFRRKYFSALASKEPVSQSDFFGDRSYPNDIEEQRLTVEAGDGHAWNFETEIFTNSYKLFQFILRPA